MNGRAGVGVVVIVAVALLAVRAQAGALPTLASGNGTSCVVFGGSAIWCWGRNDVGQLGDGTTIDRLIPISEGSGAYSVAVGDRNVCWGHYPGFSTYVCAGANEFGQIGDGTTTERHVFTPVTALSNLGLGVGWITAGDTPCVTGEGPLVDGGFPQDGVYCWGSNQFGSVGDGTTTDRSSAAFVLPGGGILSASGGGGHACAYKGSTVWCWGNNVDDSLGLGSGAGSMSTVPAQIALPGGGPPNVDSLSVGVHHSCLSASDGTVWCWGLNDHGQLGDGTTTSRSTPVQVMGLPHLNGIWVSATGGFTCGSALDGSSAYCWGRNDRGQLGDGTTTERHVPTLVIGLDNAIAQIVPGADHACAFSRGGTATTEFVRCWGANDHGQVGDGTRTERHTPVRLTFALPAPAVPARGGVPILTLVLVFGAAGAFVVTRSKRRSRSPHDGGGATGPVAP
jgi:alpha-tubulin suppressor-like RCC1 family protein